MKAGGQPHGVLPSVVARARQRAATALSTTRPSPSALNSACRRAAWPLLTGLLGFALGWLLTVQLYGVERHNDGRVGRMPTSSQSWQSDLPFSHWPAGYFDDIGNGVQPGPPPLPMPAHDGIKYSDYGRTLAAMRGAKPGERCGVWRPNAKPKLRLLLLFRNSSYHNQIDQRERAFYEAAQRSPYIDEVHVWGLGWPDWRQRAVGMMRLASGRMDEMLPTQDEVDANIIRRWGANFFDVVIGDIGSAQHTMPSRKSNATRLLSSYIHEVTCPEGIGRCQDSLYLSFTEQSNVTLFAYANAMTYALHLTTTNQGRYQDRLLVHVPMSAPAELFCTGAAADRPRNTPIKLVGKVNWLYPFRERLQRLVNSGKLSNTTARPHPFMELLANPNASVLPAKIEQEAYADDLKNSKIVLVTRSSRSYALRKYVEAAMAGALLVGNIPAERKQEFRKYVVEIDESDTDEEIVSTIEWWLKHDDERIRRARIGQELACRMYNFDVFLERCVQAWHAYLGGARGAVFPYQYTVEGTLRYD